MARKIHITGIFSSRQELEAWVIVVYHAGKTMKEIAQSVGISYLSVLSILKNVTRKDLKIRQSNYKGIYESKNK